MNSLILFIKSIKLCKVAMFKTKISSQKDLFKKIIFKPFKNTKRLINFIKFQKIQMNLLILISEFRKDQKISMIQRKYPARRTILIQNLTNPFKITNRSLKFTIFNKNFIELIYIYYNV